MTYVAVVLILTLYAEPKEADVSGSTLRHHTGSDAVTGFDGTPRRSVIRHGDVFTWLIGGHFGLETEGRSFSAGLKGSR